MSKKIICWWSGGITSAVACKIAIDLYGLSNCEFIMIDTHNEDDDTYRFKKDCEKWYGKKIDTISAIPDKYKKIQDVWLRFRSLNVATGAICSAELKREVRKKWQKKNIFKHQVFGFDFSKRELNRALAMKKNYPESKPIFPLLMMGYDKETCGQMLMNEGIQIPVTYQHGFKNNNCFKTGCVQGGVGYWQKMQRDFPEKFNNMADMEHYLTNLKGQPVTMLKDQSKKAKESGDFQVFLVKHPEYPHLKCIDDMPQRKVEPLFECNGFCGINDLVERNPVELEINFEL